MGVMVLRSHVEAWIEVNDNIELLPNTSRRALDMAVYQRRISPVERMLNREDNDRHVNLFSCESHSR